LDLFTVPVPKAMPGIVCPSLRRTSAKGMVEVEALVRVGHRYEKGQSNVKWRVTGVCWRY